MKATFQTAVKVILEMNEPEVEWLRGLLQNPLYDADTPSGIVSTESSETRKMREKFWKALSNEEIEDA